MTTIQNHDIPDQLEFRLNQSPSFDTLQRAGSDSSIPHRSMLKRNNSDSDMQGNNARLSSHWTCTLCLYENVDPGQVNCALCGIQRDSPQSPRQSHPQPHDETRLQSTPTKMDPKRSEVDSGLTRSGRSADPGLALPNLSDPADRALSAPLHQRHQSQAHPGLIKATSSVSVTNSEKADEVAPLRQSQNGSGNNASLSTFKASADIVSQKLLDMSQASLDLSLDGLQALGESNATLPTSNIRTAPNEVSCSSSTVPVSNIDSNIIANPNGADIFTDDNSEEAPLPSSMDDVSLDELFAAQMVLPKSIVISPAAPDTKATPQFGFEAAPGIVGFEAMPPSPQFQKKKPAAHAPWEMPPGANIDIEAQAPNNPTSLKMIASSSEPVDELTQEPSSKNPWKFRLCRLTVVGIIILAVVLSIVLIQDKEGDEGRGVGVLVMSAPVPPINRPPSAAPLPNTPSPTRIAQQPTGSPTDAWTVDFGATAQLDGPLEGSRFGTSVSLNHEGTLVAAVGATGLIQVYAWDYDEWSPHSTISLPPDSIFSADAALSVVSSTSNNKLPPMVAVASNTMARVVQYIDEEWIARGQDGLEWRSAIDSMVQSSVTFSAVCLSDDANTLATGSLNEAGDSIVVRVFTWTGILWAAQGKPIVKSQPATRFWSMSLSLSGDGNAVALSDWQLSLPKASVEVYEWNDDAWKSKGGDDDNWSFLWGPAAVALSQNGQRLAVTTPSPGATRIYEWKDTDTTTGAWVQVGQDLTAGSSIALTRKGNRVMIGIPLQNLVGIHDYRDGIWEANLPLNGESGSLFGSSIAMSASGNTLAVGSPLDDSNANNTGRVLVYE